MADQDFNIKVVTTADTAGIRQTSAELSKLQQQQKDFLSGGAAQTGVEKWIAAQKAAKEAAATPVAAPSSGAGGGYGSYIGLATIVTLLTAAINKVREFNEEENKVVENMISAQEKMRDFGLQLADAFDEINFQHAVDSASTFEAKLGLVAQRGRVLQEELNSAFAAGRYDDAKKYLAVLQALESEFNRLGQAAEKAAEAKAKAESSFLTGALATASGQTQAAIVNEERARQARAAGRDKEADQYQKTADQLKKSMTQEQRDEYEGLQKATTQPVGRKAGIGESQELVDQIENQRLNNERVQRGEQPRTLDQEKQGASGNTLVDAIQHAFGTVMDRYWGK